jgi:hypothetical protein
MPVSQPSHSARPDARSQHGRSRRPPYRLTISFVAACALTTPVAITTTGEASAVVVSGRPVAASSARVETAVTAAGTTTTIPTATSTTGTTTPSTTTTIPGTTAPTTATSVPVGPPGSLPAVWSEVDSPYVIDPGTANTLVASYWSLRQTDLVEGLTQALPLIEAGPALKLDVHSCGCGVIPWGPELAESSWVTEQTAFPAYFMAEGVARIPSTSTQGALVVLVFQRLSASTAWKVVVDSQQQLLTTNEPFEDISNPATDLAGFDVDVPTKISGGIPSLPGKLARYWDYWAEHGKAPTGYPFMAGLFTNQRGESIWGDETVPDVAGYSERYRYTPVPARNAWKVPGPGYELSCGSFTENVTIWNPEGYVSQPRTLDVFPSSLPAGDYSKVVIGKVSAPCFETHPNGRVFVLGAAPWEVSVTGYPPKV